MLQLICLIWGSDLLVSLLCIESSGIAISPAVGSIVPESLKSLPRKAACGLARVCRHARLFLSRSLLFLQVNRLDIAYLGAQLCSAK